MWEAGQLTMCLISYVIPVDSKSIKSWTWYNSCMNSESVRLPTVELCVSCLWGLKLLKKSSFDRIYYTHHVFSVKIISHLKLSPLKSFAMSIKRAVMSPIPGRVCYTPQSWQNYDFDSCKSGAEREINMSAVSLFTQDLKSLWLSSALINISTLLQRTVCSVKCVIYCDSENHQPPAFSFGPFKFLASVFISTKRLINSLYVVHPTTNDTRQANSRYKQWISVPGGWAGCQPIKTHPWEKCGKKNCF